MAIKILLSHLLKVLPKEDRRTLNSGESGFTLIEVLVTILVVTGFILGSLQAVVLATLFRVQAQDKNEVTNWVQQDLELIRYQAFILDSNGDGTYANSGCPDSYGQTLQNLIATAHPENPSAPITLGLPSNQRTYNVTRAYSAQDNTLSITHTVSYGANHPRNNPNNSELTTLSTEIIPDAAFSCP